jgi:predicted ester cyclase
MDVVGDLSNEERRLAWWGGSCCVVGRRREHGIGPPFLGGTNQGGPGHSIRDDDPDFVSHTKLLPDQEPTREGQRWATAQFSAAASNRRIRFEDQIAAGDKVVSRSVVHATHDRGELMGLAPTGRELIFRPIDIHRIERGKIAEQWGGAHASPNQGGCG